VITVIFDTLPVPTIGHWSEVHLQRTGPENRQRTQSLFIDKCYYGGTAWRWFYCKPDHTPCLKRELTPCLIQGYLLILHFWDSANKSVEMAVPEMKWWFLPKGKEGVRGSQKGGKVRLPKFAAASGVDGNNGGYQNPVLLFSILYIYMGGRQNLWVMSWKCCLHYLTSGGKAQSGTGGIN